MIQLLEGVTYIMRASGWNEESVTIYSFLKCAMAQPMRGPEVARTGNQEMPLAEVKSNS